VLGVMIQGDEQGDAVQCEVLEAHEESGEKEVKAGCMRG
jgi:hypothetical protein